MAGVSVACRVARPLTNSGKLLAVAGLNKVSFETKTVGQNFVIKYGLNFRFSLQIWSARLLEICLRDSLPGITRGRLGGNSFSIGPN